MAPSDLKSTCIALLEQALAAVAPGSGVTVQLERPKQRSHGDYACNLAMQLAKPLGRPPREIAAQLIAALPSSGTLEKAEIAGPGFINLTVSRAARRAVVHVVRSEGAAYGRRAPSRRQRVQVEFVSANPTGPLHVGPQPGHVEARHVAEHGRCGIGLHAVVVHPAVLRAQQRLQRGGIEAACPLGNEGVDGLHVLRLAPRLDGLEARVGQQRGLLHHRHQAPPGGGLCACIVRKAS